MLSSKFFLKFLKRILNLTVFIAKNPVLYCFEEALNRRIVTKTIRKGFRCLINKKAGYKPA